MAEPEQEEAIKELNRQDNGRNRQEVEQQVEAVKDETQAMIDQILKHQEKAIKKFIRMHRKQQQKV